MTARHDREILVLVVIVEKIVEKLNPSPYLRMTWILLRRLRDEKPTHGFILEPRLPELPPHGWI
jgi:hypothetical protein